MPTFSLNRKISPADIARQIPGPSGERYAVAFEHGTLEIELYQPREIDSQQPHRRDEAYIVIAGSGTFVVGSERLTFAPGDFLFAPAGVPHRFEYFSSDLSVWVIFYGPDGGEKAPP